eukprot:Hpha_TRINITY_DN3132_c0_g1::TRINITY_DN3132_c0_g1_i1::g.96773::m.96773
MVVVHYMPWFAEGGIHENPNSSGYTKVWPHADLCFADEEFPAWYPPRDRVGNPMPRFNSSDAEWAEKQVEVMAQYCVDGVIIDFGPKVINNATLDPDNIIVRGTVAIVAAVVKAGLRFALMVDSANWKGVRTYQFVWECM